jgi:hypothetical protein
MKRLIPLAFVVALIGCGHSPGKTQSPVKETVPRGSIIEYGIYKAVRKGQLQDDLATTTGKVINRPVLELVEQTNRIPIKKDAYFAYQYRILQLPAMVLIKPWIELRRVLIHPEMIRPDGSRTKGSERLIRGKVDAGQVMGWDGYAFNEDYEMVEGDWIFQLWYQDNLLVEQKFTSYRPTGQ